MFNTFTFTGLASLMLAAMVATSGAGPAEAGKRNKQNVPGHWERSQDGGFEWVGKKKFKPKNAEPVVRDHRNGSVGGGVTVSETAEVRDHRTKAQVRDHRAGAEPTVNQGRKKKKYIGIPLPF